MQRVLGISNEFEAPKGSVVVERGQAGTGLFIIEEGAARVDLPDGRHVELGEGDFFGEIAVVAETPRTARVAATTELRGLAIRRTELMSLLESEPSIAVAMLRVVAGRLAEAIEHRT